MDSERITMNAYKIETTINEQGQLVLTNLPFLAGETVEVIILERSVFHSESNLYPLQGTVQKYDRPFDPAILPEEEEVEV